MDIITAYTWAAPQRALALCGPFLQDSDLAELGVTRQPAERERRLAARALLRGLLRRVAGPGPAAAAIRRSPFGAPELGDGCGWSVNVSHTRGLVAAAVSRGAQVGMDVERHDDALDHAAVAQRFFHASECADLARLSRDGDEGRTRFFALWTGKEAVAKALGMGLERELPMKSFSLQWPAEGADPHRVSVHGAPVRPDGLRVRSVRTLPAPDGFHAALALAEVEGAAPEAAPTFVELGHG